MRVGLAGLGTVGSEVARQLHARGGTTVLGGVAVRDTARKRDVDLGGVKVTNDPLALARAESIDVFVELMGGIDVAYASILAALDSGKHVVTANKQLMAARGADLATRARDKGVCLRMSAAVGGGVPVLELLGSAQRGETITDIHGILNGTTSFILGNIADGGDYASALTAAQERGWAEADPTEDVEGLDSAAKIAVSASITWNGSWTVDDVAHRGITDVDAADVHYAAAMDCAVVLLASARRSRNTAWLSVAPTVLPRSGHALSSLTQLKPGGNGVVVYGTVNDPIVMLGTGAGAQPTASAVLSDIELVSQGAGTDWTGKAHIDIGIPSQRETGAYLRLRHANSTDVVAQFLEDRGVPVTATSEIDATTVVVLTGSASVEMIDGAIATLDSLGDVSLLSRLDAVA